MNTEIFPDGTPIDKWFYNTDIPKLDALGTQYDITDYGARDDGGIYTKEIQSAIDTAAADGGVIVVPEGTYKTGALFFKKGVNLYIKEGGMILGSDDISDYPVCMIRIEGETCPYFPALINADKADGFIMCGNGTIDGNGHRAWKSFWIRRQWNKNCTNKDEQRPRLVYISNSSNVLIAGLTIQNSHFWTTHIYKCDHVKYIDCKITSPAEPVPAPSTDAIDIDACTDVLVKNCYMAVNDDAVALKGGKGSYADTLPENGINERVIVEDCEYGFCHSCLTCGSESIHSRNIIIRRIKVDGAHNLLWLKFRPDTPQTYEYIRVEDIEGTAGNFILIHPWTQFFDLNGRTNKPVSVGRNITMCGCRCECKSFFNVTADESKYILSDFTFENLNIKAENTELDSAAVRNMTTDNVTLNKQYSSNI